MNSLVARKQALVAESEVYRQSLRLEVQNVRLYAARVRKRVGLLRAAKPLLFLLPLAGSLFGSRAAAKSIKKPRGWRRWLGLGLLSWRMYRRISPVLQSVGSLRRFGGRLKSVSR